MNEQFLSADQWSELSEAIDLFDRNGNRAPLNRILSALTDSRWSLYFLVHFFVLVSVLKSFIESLDDESPMDNEEDMEQQFIIASIESELADILADHSVCP